MGLTGAVVITPLRRHAAPHIYTQIYTHLYAHTYIYAYIHVGILTFAYPHGTFVLTETLYQRIQKHAVSVTNHCVWLKLHEIQS